MNYPLAQAIRKLELMNKTAAKHPKIAGPLFSEEYWRLIELIDSRTQSPEARKRQREQARFEEEIIYISNLQHYLYHK